MPHTAAWTEKVVPPEATLFLGVLGNPISRILVQPMTVKFNSRCSEARRAESDDLRVGFEKHLEQTKGHLERLRLILETMGEKATGKKCAAMTGLIKER
jgi:hypothetical protein